MVWDQMVQDLEAGRHCYEKMSLRVMVGGLSRLVDRAHQAQTWGAWILCVFDVHFYCDNIGDSRGKEKSEVETLYRVLYNSCEVPCCSVAFREGGQNTTSLKGFSPGTRGKVTF